MKRILLPLLILCCLLMGCVAQPLSDGDKYYESETYTADESHTAVEILNINWVSGTVEIIPYDGDTITFFERSEDGITEQTALRWYQENNSLTIDYLKPRPINTTDISKSLTVYIPKDRDMLCMELINVSGNISLSDLSTRELFLENVSGNCSAENVTVGSQAALESVSGNISASLTGELALLEINNVSGSTQLSLPDSPGFTLDLNMLSGDFSSDLALTKSGDGWIYGDGSMELEANIVSGNFKLS